MAWCDAPFTNRRIDSGSCHPPRPSNPAPRPRLRPDRSIHGPAGRPRLRIRPSRAISHDLPPCPGADSEHTFDIILGMPPRYAELHCHSNFSFLDGASHPGELVERAAELGYEGLALTDHDGFYGAVRFWERARQLGLPAIHGVELGLVAGAGDDDPISVAESWDRDRGPINPDGRGRNRQPHGTKPTEVPVDEHLVLLAGSTGGYHTLSRLVTRGQLRGEKDGPTHVVGDVISAASHPDVWALSGCRRGAVPAAALRGDLEGALRHSARLRKWFGGRFLLEIWDHDLPEDDKRNDIVWEVSQRLGIDVVATNQVHHTTPTDAVVAEVLAAIGGRRTLWDGDAFRPATDQRHIRHPAEMERRFRRYPGAVERTVEMAQHLAFDLGLVAPGLPGFEGGEVDEMTNLRKLTWKGAAEVYPGDGPDGIDPVARVRLEHELDVIERLDFPGYFLVVHDLVGFARDRDIMCQIRGSGADSAICRCLGLTRVDPIRLDLPFERFLSEERGSAPDIDLDLEADRREEVIQYCYRTYGRGRAAMVANVITYRARSVLRDVAKTFGFTPSQVDGLSRYVDTHNVANLRLEAELPQGMTAELVYQICNRIDGFPRHLGIHSGGVVIADRPLWRVGPLEWGRMEGRTVLQWDKDDCAAIGMVKFDLLGLGMLEALHLAVDDIRDTHGIDIDLATIPQESVLYDMLTDADTVGLFQVESRAQMATLPRLRPQNFYDLAVEVALIRPGPIQGQSVHPYLNRRNGRESVRYPHPSTEPILAKTLGVPIFQEQLMEMTRICAGFTPGQTDRLRQAMTHKRSAEAMGRLRDEVYEGMARNSIRGAAADEIWEKLQGFASFGFPESHSVSFAYIVYMSAWLRFHYPTEFLVGLLNAQPMGFYSPNSLVQDAQRHGVIVRGPHVNHSDHDCTLEWVDTDPSDVVTYKGRKWRRGRGYVDDPPRRSVAARLGLRYVKGLGTAEIGRIEAARMIGGGFTTGEDLAHRTGLSRKSLEALAMAGAMPDEDRRRAIWAAGALAEIDPERLPLGTGVEAPYLGEMSDVERHHADLFTIGISVTHPMSFVREELASQGVVTTTEAVEGNKRRVEVGGVITHRQRPETAGGVIFINLEDETGMLNVVVYARVWDENRPIARRSPALIVGGELERRDGVVNLIAHTFRQIDLEAPQSRDFR
ncbi:MAG: DNA polymerase III subunit alpha [Acidimicrobiia bacterium]|nr:DNA polymerase III subunit alpha [Acidimicrobiia bacterium]